MKTARKSLLTLAILGLSFGTVERGIAQALTADKRAALEQVDRLNDEISKRQ